VAVTGVTAIAFGVGGNVAAAVTNFAVWVVLLVGATADLWRSNREERLGARWPLMILFIIHALIFAGGLFDFVTGTLHAGIDAPRINTLFGLSYFETILYSMGSAFFMSLICKEREENRYILAARNDSLTGTANRGAFFEHAARLLTRCHNDGTPLSLIVFDLDRFKSVNDAHGHAVGDDVLRVFADTVRALLRPNDLFGRHGGEEFAVALPGATVETAYVIAERVRHAFGEASRNLDGRSINATVSAGVACAEPGQSFEAAMYAADMAMYRAKERGRNRVERDDPSSPYEASGGQPKTNVIRVA